MDYIPLESFQHYEECARLVDGLGFGLVELKVSPQKGVVHVQAVVSPRDPSAAFGVDDCARVHRALLARLEELLGHDDISMELSSPGTERNIRNAAEFRFFAGRRLRVWSREESEWVSGVLVSSDSERLVLRTDGGEREFAYGDVAKAKFVSA